MAKAYSYIRFSSPEQARGDSYRRQREAAESYCAENGLEFVDSRDYLFFDRGVSAYSGKHVDDAGELARFLNYVKEGEVERGSYLIVESLDRLSREAIKDALPRFLDLLNSGINIYTSIDRQLYTSKYDEKELFMSIFTMSRAHNESKTKSERVQKAWRNKQRLARESKTPLGAACPQWLKLEGGKYIEIPERVAIIKKIFKLSQDGYGQRRISAILNEECAPVFGTKNRNNRETWGASSVTKILYNRALIGEYQPTGLVDNVRQDIGEPVKDFFPIIISEDEFYETASVRSLRRVSKATKTTDNFNVWQGVAKCGKCKASMHLVDKGKPPKGGKYLRCYESKKGVCKAKLVRLDRSEEVFKEILVKIDSLSLIQDSQASLKKKVAAVDGRISEVRERIAQVQGQLLSFSNKISETIVSVLVSLEDDLKELGGQREKLMLDISREKIKNKDDFFSKLDLVTYAGRSRANSLLKNLSIKVEILREDASKSILYRVEQGADKILEFVQKDDSLSVNAYSTEVFFNAARQDIKSKKTHFSLVMDIKSKKLDN